MRNLISDCFCLQTELFGRTPAPATPALLGVESGAFEHLAGSKMAMMGSALLALSRTHADKNDKRGSKERGKRAKLRCWKHLAPSPCYDRCGHDVASQGMGGV